MNFPHYLKPSRKMIFRIISYIKFLLRSTNHHGVHSPFIYSYITKCIYGQKKLHKDKFANLVLISCVYFNPSQVNVNKCPSALQNSIQKKLKNLHEKKSKYNIVCWPNPSYNFKTIDFNAIHPSTIIIINNIRENTQQLNSWNAIRKQKNITVSIDFFSQGVLFFRKEQEKQHFVIRS